MKRLASSVAVLAISLLSACAAEPAIAPPPPIGAAARPRAARPSRSSRGRRRARIAADVTYLASPELARPRHRRAGRRARARVRRQALRRAPPRAARRRARELPAGFEARVGVKATPPVVRRAGARRDAPPRWPRRRSTADGSASGTVARRAGLRRLRHLRARARLGRLRQADAEGEDRRRPRRRADAAATARRRAPRLRLVRYKLRTAREHGAAGVVIVARARRVRRRSPTRATWAIPGVAMPIAEANSRSRRPWPPRRRAVAPRRCKTDAQRAKPRLALRRPKLWDAKEPARRSRSRKDVIGDHHARRARQRPRLERRRAPAGARRLADGRGVRRRRRALRSPRPRRHVGVARARLARDPPRRRRQRLRHRAAARGRAPLSRAPAPARSRRPLPRLRRARRSAPSARAGSSSTRRCRSISSSR